MRRLQISSSTRQWRIEGGNEGYNRRGGKEGLDVAFDGEVWSQAARPGEFSVGTEE